MRMIQELVPGYAPSPEAVAGTGGEEAPPYGIVGDGLTAPGGVRGQRRLAMYFL